MKDILQLLEEPTTTVAVVGATDDPSKYGHTIYRDLKRKGFRVYPVNRNRETIDGDKAYASLELLPEEPTIVNLVVPPTETMEILRQCLMFGFLNVWLQPGAEDPASLEYLQKHSFNYLANACIMVESRLKE